MSYHLLAHREATHSDAQEPHRQHFVSMCKECVHEGRGDLYSRGLENHYVAVHCFLVSLCRDGDVAEDLVQQTYLRAYQHLARHELRIERPRQWLLTIARCVYIDRV